MNKNGKNNSANGSGGGGCRVIVPHLRGHGTTPFLSGGTFRKGRQAQP